MVRAPNWRQTAAATAILLAGCGRAADSPERTPVVVFAASSLTDAFGDIESRFEKAHPGIDVQLNFAGSQVLRLQLEQGASADVFASANEDHMRALEEGGLEVSPRVFAANELVVITPEADGRIERFDQLDQAPKLVIGTANVPVGAYTRQVFGRARAELGPEFVAKLRDNVVSEESNVRLVRAKVEMGEADAAIVYRTDATVAQRVKMVTIPESMNVRANYPVGRLARSPHPEQADAFVDFLVSEHGRHALRRYGFVTRTR